MGFSQTNERVIDARPPRWAQRIRALVQSTDLIHLFVRRDWTSKYAQTWLGPAWFVVQPLVTTAVFTVVFSKFIGSKGESGFLFFWPAVIAWYLFAQTALSVSRSLLNHAQLLEKVYFPRMVLPLSSAFSPLPGLGLQVVLFFFVWAARMNFHFEMFFYLCSLFFVWILGFSVGLIIASATVRMRDLIHGVDHFLPLGLFVSPVFFRLSDVAGVWHTVLLANPLTGFFELGRAGLLGAPIEGTSLLASFSILMALLLVALGLFFRIEEQIVDSL